MPPRSNDPPKKPDGARPKAPPPKAPPPKKPAPVQPELFPDPPAAPAGTESGGAAAGNAGRTSAPAGSPAPSFKDILQDVTRLTQVPTEVLKGTGGTFSGQDASLKQFVQDRRIVVPERPAAVRSRVGGSLLARARQQEEKGRLLAASDKSPHVIVKARAGTGKTTTLVGGLKRLRGINPGIVPSPQQAVVWDSIALSQGLARSICITSFANGIVDELKSRVEKIPGVDAKTMHSIGRMAVVKAWNLNSDPKKSVDGNREVLILANLLGMDIWAARRQYGFLIKLVKQLTGLAKGNLIGWDPVTKTLNLEDQDLWEAELSALCHKHDIQTGNQERSFRAEAFAAVPEVLRASLEVPAEGKISFSDMIWLPVVLQLPLWVYDLLLVDEAQDLNRCQQMLSRMLGNRLVYCGDDCQAIYGFAGADTESLPRLAEELKETDRGCEVLPLTVTRRCGKKIVEEARKYVPDFEAHPDNPEGEIREFNYPVQRNRKTREVWELPDDETYLVHVQPGDMVLCRANAPLVTQCFRFLKRGMRARIMGRSIGEGLISMIEEFGVTKAPDLVTALAAWLTHEIEKENAEKMPSEEKIIGLTDKHDCLRFFVDDAPPDCPNAAAYVIGKINELFTDDREAESVLLASCHKAKGLEAERVFYLRGFGRPIEKMKPWEREQENHLRYVSITRAKSYLAYVI